VFHQLDELLPASSVPLDDLLAVALLLFFGITTLKVGAGSGACAGGWDYVLRAACCSR